MSFLSLYQSLPTLTMLVFFCLILGIVAYFFYAYKKEKEFSEADKANLQDYEKILLLAHKQARQVVEKASKKAQKILGKTTDFDRDALALLTTNLQRETAEMMQHYHNSLTTTVQGESQMMKQTADTIEKLTEKEIQTYTQSLQQTLVVSQDKINQEVASGLEKAKTEIESYKATQLAKANEEIKAAINTIALKILGHTIPMEEHEKLIVESLQQAKEEGLFSV